MKILVIGKGFIGKPLAEYLGADIWPDRLADIGVDDLKDYDVVINCAAKTTIDWCEQHRMETFDTNITQAVRLGMIIDAYCPNTLYVFFSSGCIFKSDTPEQINCEDAQPNPQCFYTYTKLMAEQLLAEVCPNALIIRPRLIISEHSHPRNTINKLLSYEKVITSQESATVLEDLLPMVKTLIDDGVTGPVNLFNEGTISPSEIMDYFHKDHIKINKFELDMLTVGKAKRVSTVLGTYYPYILPNIHDRVMEIRNNWVYSQ
jgi:dTDP-4-dehydrorhamnose reductase